MACIPSADQVRDLLEKYCLDSQSTLSLTGTISNGSVFITNVSDTSQLKTEMQLSGDQIAKGSKIVSIDKVNSTITMDIPATGDGTDFTVTFFDSISTEWIVNQRDKFIIPWIERKCRVKINSTAQREEFISGNGGNILILDRKPIISLDELKYVQSLPDNESDAKSTVILNQEEGILVGRYRVDNSSDISSFPRGDKNIFVKYTYGFADLESEAPDLCEAIIFLLAVRALIQIGSRSGGGNISLPGYGRTFGNRGKYTEIINMLERDAREILSGYWSGVVGP